MLSAPVLLATDYQLDDFACAVDSLDDWLKRRAYPESSQRSISHLRCNRRKKSCRLLLSCLRRIGIKRYTHLNSSQDASYLFLSPFLAVLLLINPIKAEDLVLPYFKMPSFARRKLEVFLAYTDFLYMRFQLRQRLSMSIMGSSPHRHNL